LNEKQVPTDSFSRLGNYSDPSARKNLADDSVSFRRHTHSAAKERPPSLRRALAWLGRRTCLILLSLLFYLLWLYLLGLISHIRLLVLIGHGLS
jgi:hypothetical protein